MGSHVYPWSTIYGSTMDAVSRLDPGGTWTCRAGTSWEDRRPTSWNTSFRVNVKNRRVEGNTYCFGITCGRSYVFFGFKSWKWFQCCSTFDFDFESICTKIFQGGSETTSQHLFCFSPHSGWDVAGTDKTTEASAQLAVFVHGAKVGRCRRWSGVSEIMVPQFCIKFSLWIMAFMNSIVAYPGLSKTSWLGCNTR